MINIRLCENPCLQTCPHLMTRISWKNIHFKKANYLRYAWYLTFKARLENRISRAKKFCENENSNKQAPSTVEYSCMVQQHNFEISNACISYNYWQDAFELKCSQNKRRCTVQNNQNNAGDTDMDPVDHNCFSGSGPSQFLVDRNQTRIRLLISKSKIYQ